MTEDQIKEELIGLYAELAALTAKGCAAKGGCRGGGEAGACCEPDYCRVAAERAKKWGVEVGEPPFNANGPCVVPPHLRPLCAIHQCEIASIAWMNGLSTGENERYFAMRGWTNELEWALLKLEDHGQPA